MATVLSEGISHWHGSGWACYDICFDELATFTSSHSHCVNVLNQVLACVASHIRLLLYMQIKYVKYNYSFLSIYSVLTSAWI